jgi:aminoglycoside 3-N-acetyltransferase I
MFLRSGIEALGMDYAYKQLSPSDISTLKNLLALFGKAFDDVPTYQDAVPGDAYLKSLLSKAHVIVLVSSDSTGAVAGGLVAYELDKFEQARREIYIYDLAVSEGHRRRGVATGLIDALKRIARERNAYVIFVQADHGDTPAIRLYESLGVREDVYHFDIPVVTAPSK